MGWTASRVSPASSGSGAVSAYWCWTGTSGSCTPASRATFGPQIPAASTTVSVRIVPRVVSTARTAPRSISKPVTAQPLGREQLGGQPVRHRAAEPPVQLLPARRRGRDLDPADAVEAAQLAEQL